MKNQALILLLFLFYACSSYPPEEDLQLLETTISSLITELDFYEGRRSFWKRTETDLSYEEMDNLYEKNRKKFSEVRVYSSGELIEKDTLYFEHKKLAFVEKERTDVLSLLPQLATRLKAKNITLINKEILENNHLHVEGNWTLIPFLKLSEFYTIENREGIFIGFDLIRGQESCWVGTMQFKKNEQREYELIKISTSAVC